MRKWTLSLLLLVNLVSCQSTEPERDELDLPSSKIELSARSNPAQARASDPSAMPSQEIFDWQRLYKSTPSLEEQKSISAKLQEPSPTQGSFEQRLNQARNILALGQRAEAKDLYMALLLEKPESLEVHLELTHIYLAESNSDRAFDYLSSIRKILDAQERPAIEHTFRYRYALALAYIQTQNRKLGHEILSSLLENDPNFIPAYAALAQSYLQQNKIEIAEFIAKRGLDRGVDDPRLLNLIGITYLRRNRPSEARTWIQKALAQNPDFVPALINRAHLALLRREFALAENDLTKAASLDPLSVDGQMALGLLYRKTGRLTAAKGALEKAVVIDPMNAFARYHLGLLLVQEFKDKTAALQLFYDVLQARDDESELKNLAKIQIQSIRDSRLYER